MSGKYFKVKAGRPLVGEQAFSEIYLVNEDGTPWSPDDSNSLAAALPRLMGTISGYNDVTESPLRIIGLGSSVGLGPNGGLDAVNSVSAYLKTAIDGAINRLGNLNTQHTNGSVAGSTITEGYTTHYAAAKTAAGGSPGLVSLAYGMNDGMPAQYHAGQTFTAVLTRAKQIIELVRGDGGDPVLFTTPHPHSTRTPWTYGGPATYPSGQIVPAGDAAGSVVNVPSPTSGEMVPASYRHLRVNEAIRRAATELGAVLIDTERYWFDAIALYGEDALFNEGQYNHPNLFGYQKSYHKSIDAFAKSLVRPAVAGGAAPLAPDTLRRKTSSATSTSTTRVTDTQLSFTAGANTSWEVNVDLLYNVPTANDLRISWEVPAGSAGAMSGMGPSISTTGVNGGEVTARSAPDLVTSMAFGGNTSGAYVQLRAIVRVGATAGVIGLQFGLDVTGGTATLYTDSLLRAREIV